MTAREVALKILYDTEQNDAFLNVAFAKNLETADLAPQDSGFVKELVFGVFRYKIYLDYIIRKNSSIRLKKIEPKVLNILRMGVYQILFMDKVPSHAAVSESVTLAKKHSFGRTPGFVNAVLRSLLRTGAPDLSELLSDKIKYLSVKHSYPEPLVKFFIDTFGERAEKMLSAGNETPPLCIRVNTLKTTKKKLIEKLEEAEISAKQTPYCDSGLYLFNASEKKRAEFNGLFCVQDQSSQLSALALDPQKNDVVLDLCSAPGGKTTHLAELMENEGKILAFDLYEHRLTAVDELSKKLGISIIKTKAQDALVFCPELENTADKILLDVPCSGLGIIRRKPDIKYKDNITDFSEIVDLQKKILDNAKKYLKVGGVMVYSTCTVNPAENREQIDLFLKENKNFSLDEISSKHITGEMAKRAKKGYLEIFPDTDNSDGFFVCRLVKKG